jgi:CheY-like chemotaxis protein
MPGTGVLVLTKEADFGASCAEVFAAMGYECRSMIADAGFSMAALVDQLATGEQRLVLCESKMPSLTALSVLRAVRALPSRVAVAALDVAYDRKAHSAFMGEGGAAYVVLQEDLKQVIDDVWLQVNGYQERKGVSRNRIVDFLSALTDEALFRRFAIRLFHELNYREVRETHGVGEAGKDIVFYEQNRLGELEFVAVQVKVGDIHANVARPGNVSALWLQVMEAFTSPVRFGGEEHLLDKLVLLTSGDFTEPARAQLRDFLQANKYQKRVYMWGREKIADLVAEHAPAVELPPDVTGR